MDHQELTPDSQISIRFGQMSAVFERGQLRWVSDDHLELIRGVLFAVRDPFWGTLLPQFDTYYASQAEDSFEIHYDALYREGEIAFACQCRISGDENGVRFRVEGNALADFDYARIGLCVLQPGNQAGSEVKATTRYGSFHGVLPREISPVSLADSVETIAIAPTPFHRVAIEFEGALFSVEDQRNWSDHSFKFYSSTGPWPDTHTMAKGQRITQAVRISVDRSTSDRPIQGPLVSKMAAVSEKGQPDIRPGTWPRLGLTILEPPNEEAIDSLRSLDLNHARVVVDVLDEPGEFMPEVESAAHLNLPIELELVMDRHTPMEKVRGVLRELTQVAALDSVLVFDRALNNSSASLARLVRTSACVLPDEILIGGGSRANFAELNVSRLGLNEYDMLAFPVCPQVHAFDDETILESIDSIDSLIATARTIHDVPVAVGPLTLRPRFKNHRTTSSTREAIRAAARYEPRQRMPIAAAWLLGCLARLSNSSVRSVTLFEASGPNGLIEVDRARENLRVLPVYHVLKAFRWLSEMSGKGDISVDRTFATLSSTSRSSSRVVVISLTPRVGRFVLPAGHPDRVYDLDGSQIPISRDRSVELRGFHGIKYEMATPERGSQSGLSFDHH